MKTPKDVAIAGYGVYIPRYRLPSEEVSRMWRGGEEALPIKKAVAALDEDSATMAVEAARRAVEMAEVKKLGAIFVGTETKPYAVKPTSVIVAEALAQHQVLASDLEFACKAGTEALQLIIALIGSGMIESGLAIGVDAAQGRPGDDLEFTAASAAAAYVLSKRDRNSIAVVEGASSYVSDTTDFWRRAGQRYPRHLSRFTGEPAYFHHIQSAVKNLFDEFGYKPSDFRYAVFHQPNPRFPVEVALRLGFSFEQIKPGLMNPYIGNPYAANSLIGLALILEEAKPNDLILVCSFGSGAGSDALSIRVLDGIVEKVGKSQNRVRDMLKAAVDIDYATYAKFRGKILV
jgi:hydroxymethylglutaryl-CoA synthase